MMRTWLRVMGVMCLLTAALPVGAGLILLEAVSSGHLSEDVWRWLHDALAGAIAVVVLVALSLAAFGLAGKLCILESLAAQLSGLRAGRPARDGSDTPPGREERETIPEWLRAMGWLCLVPALLIARYVLTEISAPWTHLYALGALAVALAALSCLSFAVARSVKLEQRIASDLGRVGEPGLEPAGDNTGREGARTRSSALLGAGLRGWLMALGVLCLLPAPIIAYDLLVSTVIYTIWPHWSHVALVFAGSSVCVLVATGSLALASARGLNLLGPIAERLPPAHSPQASVRQNAYLYIAGLLSLLPMPLIVSYAIAERSWLHLEGFRALAVLIFWLTALSCISFSIARSRRTLATIRAHVESFEPPSDADGEHEVAVRPPSPLRDRALVGAGVLLLIAIPLANYQQALYRQGAHLGGLLGWAGRYEDALTAWEWAVRSDPDDANAHHGRGAMLAGLGRYEEAVSALDRAIELDPSDAMAYYNRGWALMKLGRYEPGLRAFDEAIRLDPADALAHYNRACSYSLLGMSDEALRDLERAIELDGTLRQTARTDDDLAGLQGHPAFEALVQVGAR